MEQATRKGHGRGFREGVPGSTYGPSLRVADTSINIVHPTEYYCLPVFSLLFTGKCPLTEFNRISQARRLSSCYARRTDGGKRTITMAVADLPGETEQADLGRDVVIVGTISAAHFCSHFYQFTIPLLFPRLQAEYGVGLTELGLLVTVFYASSGFAQTAAGFLVDHVGPSRVLTAGLGLLAASMALVALVPSFWLIYPAAALAGLGNSVFHPADYSIMSRRGGTWPRARPFPR